MSQDNLPEVSGAGAEIVAQGQSLARIENDVLVTVRFHVCVLHREKKRSDRIT